MPKWSGQSKEKAQRPAVAEAGMISPVVSWSVASEGLWNLRLWVPVWWHAM